MQADRRPRGSHVPAAPRDLRRYLDVLPGGDSDGWISLGEGGTPLLRSRVVGPALDLTNLYFKIETVNPTASFKDRYVAVTVNIARQLGYRRVVVSRTRFPWTQNWLNRSVQGGPEHDR